MKVLSIPDPDAMERLGASFLRHAPPRAVVYLRGDLGTGKTTFVRGFLRAAGVGGAVKSPTYTLLEPYELDGRNVFHLDLYRLDDAEELELIGIRDYVEAGLLFVEWPDRGAGALPGADIEIRIAAEGAARRVSLDASSGAGAAWLDTVETPD